MLRSVFAFDHLLDSHTGGAHAHMPGKYAKKERASPESRSLLQTSVNASPEDNDPENHSFSAVTDEPDLQRLLEDDSLTEELSHKRPRAWTNSPSSVFSRRPQRIRRLARRSAGICDACTKLMPKRRKGLRTLLLLGLGTILSLYGLVVVRMAGFAS